MKTFLGKILSVVVIAMASVSLQARAESTVYFFLDFRNFIPEYTVKINGEDGFVLKPEGKPVMKGSTTLMYNMCARKVVFEHPDSYVLSIDCPTPKTVYHAELNLNLEDGETFYVLCNGKVGKAFYMELVPEKEGLKLLKKAQTSKKYTINEDYVYKAK